MELIGANVEAGAEKAIAVTHAVIGILMKKTMAVVAQVGTTTEEAGVLALAQDRLMMIDIIGRVVEGVEMTKIGPESEVLVASATVDGSALQVRREPKVNLLHLSLPRTNVIDVPSSSSN